LVVTKVQEVCVNEYEPQIAPYQVPRDEQEGDRWILDDLEPIIAPFESHAEFQEDEGDDLNTQECSLVPPISEDENFSEEEPHFNQVEVNQQGISFVPILVEASSLPFIVVVQEQLNMISLQHEIHFWFNQRMMSLTLCLRFHIERLFFGILRLIRSWISEFNMT
jgi:hypothetical protein